MSILDFLLRNRGKHATCAGCHWHVVVSGWRCCGCKRSASSRTARPANTGDCRLDQNSTPPPAIAGQQHRNRVTDDDTLRWLSDLTEPADEPGGLPGPRRRLARRHHINQSRTGRPAST